MKHFLLPLFLFAFTAPASAGDITRPDATTDFQWRSTECPKPIPQAERTGVTSEQRLMAYARDIEIYIDCIQREAQRDFDQARSRHLSAVIDTLRATVRLSRVDGTILARNGFSWQSMEGLSEAPDLEAHPQGRSILSPGS